MVSTRVRTLEFTLMPLRLCTVSCTLLCTLLAAAARADAPPAPALLDLKEISLTYTVVHKLHVVTATCKVAEGKAAVTPGGPARVQVRAKVACFDSGDSNRDVHMREVTHEALHPYVSVKGTIDAVALPISAPVERTLNARVELNGEAQTVAIPITLSQEGSVIRGRAKFPVSLDGFKIERPSLLTIKVEDTLTLEGDLAFEAPK